MSSLRNLRSASPTNPTRLRVVTAALCVAALLGAAGTAGAEPPKRDYTLLTNTAALTQGPVTRVAADDAPIGDALDSPANRMVVRSDQLLIGDRDGTSYNEQRYRLDKGQTAGDHLPDGARNLLDSAYPSAAGRFRTEKADDALAFRHQQAGGQGLFTLSAIGQAADRAKTSYVGVQAFEIGKTYTMSFKKPTGSARYLLQAPTSSLADSVAMADTQYEWRNDMQWTVLPASVSGYVRFASVLDGQCLDAVGGTTTLNTPIGTYPCVDGAANQEWRIDTHHLVNRRSNLKLTPTNDGVVQTTSLSVENAALLHEVVRPQPLLPTVSYGDLTGDATSPYDLAVGDLDNAVDTASQSYRDEAIIAWASDHQLNVRVVDYNRPGAPYMLVAPDQAITTTIGGPDGSRYRQGSLNTAVGDFNDDGQNDIAVTWQDASSQFRVAFLRYDTSGDQPKLTVVKAEQPLMAGLQDAPAPLRVSGLADLIAGDFDGSHRDSLALGWGGIQGTFDDGRPVPLLTVARFDSAFKPDWTHWTRLSFQKVTLASSDQPATNMGIRLAAGLFKLEEGNLHRRQIASVARLENRQVGSSNVRQVSVVGVQDDGLVSVYTPLWMNDDVAGNSVAIAAGGFAGQGKPEELPLWDLAVTTSDGASYVQLLSMPTSGSDLSKPWRTPNVNGRRQLSVTAYDYAGGSLMVGAPVRFSYTNVDRIQVAAAQPPTHSDWLNGSFVNVNRDGEFKVKMGNTSSQTFTSSQTVTKGHAIGVGEDSKFDIGGDLDLGILDVNAHVKIGQKMEKEWESEDKTLTGFDHDEDVKLSSTTADDDYVRGGTRTTDIYRYPILNQPVLDADGNPVTDPDHCPKTCYASYEISVPRKVEYRDWDGRTADFYQPTWLNGNVLSYPTTKDNLVPAGDLGSYSYPTNGKTQTRSDPIFDATYPVGSNTATYEVSLKDTADTEKERTTNATLANSAFVTLTQKVKIAGAGIKGEEGATFADKQTNSTISVGETRSSTSNTFALETGRVSDPNAAFTVRSAYYFDKSGAEKVVHATDVPDEKGGWWNINYGTAPDPALNLPNAILVKKNTAGVFEELEWNTLATRQEIRGFQAVDADGGVLDSTPLAGQKVQFRVPVHNYSLQAAAPFDVRWYAVPISEGGEPGSPEQIGADQRIDGIADRGSQTVTSPQWTAKAAGDWRIFLQLNPEGTFKEIHPLNGTPCARSAVSGEALEDPMTGKNEELACGQNNQGWGKITVMPNVPGAGDSEAPDLAGSTLLDGNQLLHAAPARQIVVGQPVQGIVRAVTTGISREHQPLMIFDGDPDHGGKGVAMTTMQGVAGEKGGTASFTWTPTTAGTHVLYQRLLGRTPEEGDSEQTLTVNVAAHDDATSIRVTPERTTSTVGQRTGVNVHAYDRYGNVVENLTGKSTLTITPDGTCTATACTPAAVGKHTITATSGALTGTSTIDAVKATATTVSVQSGNLQTAAPGKAFAQPLVAKVADQTGLPMAGEPVAFTVNAGSATFGGQRTTTAVTDSAGLATAPTLTGGKTVGPVAVTATAGAATAVFVEAVSMSPATPADLKTTVKAPAKVKVGKTFTVKLNLDNLGRGNADQTLATVFVPNRYSIRAKGGGHRTGQFVFYHLDKLKAGRDHTFRLKLRAQKPGSATIVGTAMSVTPDPHRSNNTGSDTVRARR